MNLKSQISTLNLPACDLCGAREAAFVLKTPRLDGPLVRCQRCQLCYVVLPETASTNGSNGGGQPIAAEMARLAERARELALVEPSVEQSEQPWRELMAAERLADLRRFIGHGRLLEIGCATGEMLLAAAGASFNVTGIEADAGNYRVASARGLKCFNGTLQTARFSEASFDVAALYHVIEHVPSPRAELHELRRVVKPGGWLVLETPNIATPWVRLLGARWRQFIPDHIFFFTPPTLTRLCEEQGFAVRELRSVGKAMSARLFISRLGRYHQPTAHTLTRLSRRLNLDDRTLRLNLGDVMRLYAQRR